MASDDNNVDLEDADSPDEDSGPSHGYNLRSASGSSSAARLLARSQLPDTLARLINLINESPGDYANQNNDTSSSSDEEAALSFMPLRRGSSSNKKPQKPSQRQLECLKKSDFFFDTNDKFGPSLEKCHRFGGHHNLLKVIQAQEVRVLSLKIKLAQFLLSRLATSKATDLAGFPEVPKLKWPPIFCPIPLTKWRALSKKSFAERTQRVVTFSCLHARTRKFVYTTHPGENSSSAGPSVREM